MMETGPLISIIIPLYNSERYLAQCIESVLGGTYRPIDLIVVDDGSTDASASIAQGFLPEIQYVRQPNQGQAAARNRGVDLAQGDLLAFLDDDDLWTSTKLELQWAALNENPNLDMVFGKVKQFPSPDSKRTIRVEHSVLAGIHPGTMLIWKKAFLQVGYFSTNRRIGEFIDWYARAIHLGLESMMIQEIVMERRIHDSNMSHSSISHRGDYLHILKSALDRKRSSGLDKSAGTDDE